MPGHASRLHEFCSGLVEGLRSGGVTHAVVSPGYRSGPLALAAERAGLEIVVHIDERSAAYFGLGLAKSTRTPVALIATSGTAVANYMPAVVEASRSGEPLVVVTADRPPELQGWGANQTIDQQGLFGSHVRWFSELPVGSESTPQVAAGYGVRAAVTAVSPVPGPVHLNVPLRAPLRPPDHGLPEPAAAGVEAAVAPDHPFAPDELVAAASETERGVIMAGAMAPGALDHDDVLAVAAAAGWPVIAEPVSQLRLADPAHGATVISTGTLLTGVPAVTDSLTPEVLVSMGAPPPSRSLRNWIAGSGARRVFTIGAGSEWADESHSADRFVRATPRQVFAALRSHSISTGGSGDWASRWAEADAAAVEALGAAMIDAPFFEGRVVTAIAGALPDGVALFAGNSMAVRDLDLFWPRRDLPVDVYSNRGASGIDGVVSTALGVAAGGSPVVLLLGDLSFLHDMGGLLAAVRLGAPLVIVVTDNDGGGLFSQLPMAGRPEISFDELFSTPHGADLGAISTAFGLEYAEVASSVDLQAALLAAIDLARPAVIRIPVDRDMSAQWHADVAGRVHGAVLAAHDAG